MCRSCIACRHCATCDEWSWENQNMRDERPNCPGLRIAATVGWAFNVFIKYIPSVEPC